MTDVSWLAVAIVVVGSVAVYAAYAYRLRTGFYARFGPAQAIGLDEGEKVIGAWPGERYFGPLVRGSERTLGCWLSVIILNAIPGPHWLRTRPALALRGAPLWLRLTDRRRLLVTIAGGWSRSLRPRVCYLPPARRGFELLVASGPDRRARVRPVEEVFPGRSTGHFNQPNRQALESAAPSRLVVIEQDGVDPLLVWCPPQAVPALRAWARE